VSESNPVWAPKGRKWRQLISPRIVSAAALDGGAQVWAPKGRKWLQLTTKRIICAAALDGGAHGTRLERGREATIASDSRVPCVLAEHPLTHYIQTSKGNKQSELGERIEHSLSPEGAKMNGERSEPCLSPEGAKMAIVSISAISQRCGPRRRFAWDEAKLAEAAKRP
jgi:hypothetical protein